jgi:hypothetical protein
MKNIPGFQRRPRTPRDVVAARVPERGGASKPVKMRATKEELLAAWGIDTGAAAAGGAAGSAASDAEHAESSTCALDGSAPRRISLHDLSIDGKAKEDWERSEVDDVFEADSTATLTRRSSISRQSDGSLTVDDSVPDEVKQMLQQIESEKDGTAVTLTRRSSVSRQSDGTLAIDDSVPDEVKQMLRQMEAEKSPGPARASSNVSSNSSDSARPRSNSLMSDQI